MGNMWSKIPQKVIGATPKGSEIHFHADEAKVKSMPSDCRLHASQHHDRLRNNAAVKAQHYTKLNLHGAANGYKQLAAHHAEQSRKYGHFIDAGNKMSKNDVVSIFKARKKKAEDQKEDVKPSSDKPINHVEHFKAIMDKNTKNLQRLREERKTSNKSVLRSYRIKH
jgi:hypothetical protein